MAEKSVADITIEVVKIATGIATPILVAIIGFRLNKTLQRLAAAQWANQKVIEKRIAVYDELAPLLNDLYCYLMFVGNWKELKPTDIVQKKRQLDKKIYVYSALFSQEMIYDYNNFIYYCFETYVGAGQDALIRTLIESQDGDRRKVLPNWDKSWDDLFSKSVFPTDEVRSAYQQLMTSFSRELGLGLFSCEGAGDSGHSKSLNVTRPA